LTSCLREDSIRPSQRNAVEDFIICKLGCNLPIITNLHNNMDTDPTSQQLWSSMFLLVRHMTSDHNLTLNSALYVSHKLMAIPTLCNLCELGFIPPSVLKKENVALKSVMKTGTRIQDADLLCIFEAASQFGQTESFEGCIVDLLSAHETHEEVNGTLLLHMVSMVIAKVLSSVNSFTFHKDEEGVEPKKSGIYPPSLALFEGFPTSATTAKLPAMPCAACINDLLLSSKYLSETGNAKTSNVGKVLWVKLLDMIESVSSSDIPLSNTEILSCYRHYDISSADFQRVRRSIFRKTEPLLSM
jgi:hypothetical protein